MCRADSPKMSGKDSEHMSMCRLERTSNTVNARNKIGKGEAGSFRIVIIYNTVHHHH